MLTTTPKWVYEGIRDVYTVWAGRQRVAKRNIHSPGQMNLTESKEGKTQEKVRY